MELTPDQPPTITFPVYEHISNIQEDFEEVDWDDLATDPLTGRIYTVLGKDIDKCTSKHLRTICSNLGIKGVKNTTKTNMI